jgi:hypothetical protein
MGVVAFGVLDRGTNVLQVRPTTLCPLGCIFCSVDAGPRSRFRQAEYLVDPDWLAEWAAAVAREKGVAVEALIDGVGDPLSYPWIVKLVRNLKQAGVFRSVAAETHGETLSLKLIRKLEEAGLDRINLSLESLNPEKARFLSGTQWYDVSRVKSLAEFIARETSIDLHVTPVWLPGVNDEDVVEIVRWAYSIGAGKRWPPATVQKYIAHRYGRRPPGVREVSWTEFWRWVQKLERETGLRISWSMDEWGMRHVRRVSYPLRTGQVVELRILGPGWLRGEVLASTMDMKRLVTVVGVKGAVPGDTITARIVRDKDGIFIAKPL